VRIEVDRLVVVGDRMVVVLFNGVREAAVIVSWGIIGIEADRLVVVGDGALEIALGRICVAAVTESCGDTHFRKFT
jgi:hypothetical protein